MALDVFDLLGPAAVVDAGGPSSIARLSEGAAVTRKAIAKHLRALADAGLVRARRRGRERIWELEPARLDVVQQCLDQISAEWDAVIGRLPAFV